MSETQSIPQLFASGTPLEQVDWLRDSSDLLGDVPALNERMADDGYLFLRGLLNRDEVLAARKEVCDRLAAMGMLDPEPPRMDCVAAQTKPALYMPDLLARDNQQLAKVLYDGPMIAFFQRFLGENVRHYDFTWFRSVPPGRGTASHCDVVYMGRGERERLFTAWTPIGDIDFEQGGLMVLEKSHLHQRLKSTYGQMDVDSYCQNKPDAKAWGKSWGTGGYLKADPNQLRHSLGGRWLSGEYLAGDVLIFSMFTVHASLDNRSRRIRLSSDTRYQPASAPADQRWIGANPVGHSDSGKRGRIC